MGFGAEGEMIQDVLGHLQQIVVAHIIALTRLPRRRARQINDGNDKKEKDRNVSLSNEGAS